MMETKTTSNYKINTGTSTTGGSTSVTYDIKYGWVCPVCGRGVAPDQPVCPCHGEYKYIPVPTYPTYPPYPYWWYQVTCSTKG